jgi:PAS domain S-box-containing protein
MDIIFVLWSTAPFIDLPNQDITGWLGLGICLLALAWGIKSIWLPLNGRSLLWWLLLAVLFVATPISSSFLGLGLRLGANVIVPEMPVEIGMLSIMIFSALPWVLAAGLLGPLPAVGLAMMAGFTRAFGETHSAFTIIEFGFLGLVFAWSVNQSYRWKIFGLLRHPMGAFLFTALAYIPLIMTLSLFSTSGNLAEKLDYSFTQTYPFMVSRWIELFLASVPAELLMMSSRAGWVRFEKLKPAPMETSLMARFYFAIIPMSFFVILGLMVGDWVMAGMTAKQLLQQKLASTAMIATESIPHFLESGNNLINKLSQRPFVDLQPDLLNLELEKRAREVDFFQQLVMVDLNGRPMGGFPSDILNGFSLTQEELDWIKIAVKGVKGQAFAVKHGTGGRAARIVFITPVRDNSQQITSVLLGYSDMDKNPYTLPAIHSLDVYDGQAYIVNEFNQILYAHDTKKLMADYKGDLPALSSNPQDNQDVFIENISSKGARQFVYFSQVEGPPWFIVISIAATETQNQALTTAMPLLLLLVMLLVALVFTWQLLLRFLTSSLQTLAQEAALISQGKLDHSMRVHGVDEVGRLGNTFEAMRLSLKARLDDLSHLLTVSQGVSSNLNAQDSIMPILEAAMRNGAASARVVLVADVVLDAPTDGHVSFGMGRSSDLYAYLDDQIFDLMTGQDIMTIPSTVRMRRLTFPSDAQTPGAILALALRHESIYFGTLWVAYHTARNISEEEIRYLVTLAAQAALAASKAKLYATAEIGRQRLAAVLSSTPEPVLVIDEQMRLLLFNPAAEKVSGLLLAPVKGLLINEAIANPELLEMISTPGKEGLLTREVVFPGGHFYLVSVSPVAAENRQVGKVCMMRDISKYKELDIMKTEFVQMVSHNLRQPLTLMKGYVGMLEMVGSLNLQQKDYVKIIAAGTDNMNRLVTNLLNLGRIESGIALQLEKANGENIMDKVARSLQPMAEQKGIKLVCFPPSLDIPEFEADVPMLQDALHNLVENAIKFTPVNGSVRLNMSMRPNAVVFEVKDTGMGIAPLDQQKLFETFYRTNRHEAHQQKGAGLGLTIVKSIANKHHGDVWVESQLGRGSTFYISIPVRQPKMRDQTTAE